MVLILAFYTKIKLWSITYISKYLLYTKNYTKNSILRIILCNQFVLHGQSPKTIYQVMQVILLNRWKKLWMNVNEKYIFAILHFKNKSDNLNTSSICKSINFACIIKVNWVKAAYVIMKLLIIYSCLNLNLA